MRHDPSKYKSFNRKKSIQGRKANTSPCIAPFFEKGVVQKPRKREMPTKRRYNNTKVGGIEGPFLKRKKNTKDPCKDNNLHSKVLVFQQNKLLIERHK